MRLQDCQRVYFACTGNTCRSPLAERILREYLAKQCIDTLIVGSRRAGIVEHEFLLSESNPFENYLGGGLSKGTEEVILSMYRDFAFVKNHRARSFTSEELEHADLVITMEPWQKETLLQYPQAFRQDKQAKVYTLGELVGQPDLAVDDPLMLTVLQGNDEKLGTEAYMYLFKQLDELVAQIVLLQEFPKTTTIDDFFKRDLQQRYEHWRRQCKEEQGILRTIGRALQKLSSSATKEPTPFSLYEAGLYHEAIALSNTELATIVGMLEEVQRSFHTLWIYIQDPALQRSARIYQTLMHEKIIPELLMRTGYKTPQWTIDTAAVGEELETALVDISKNISNSMKRTTERDHAWLLKELGDTVLSCGHALCSREVIEKIYAGLKGEALSLLPLRDQNEINRTYNKLSETSVTWFGRDTPAYCFTNESLGDLCTASLNLDGPVLCVTASGDALCLLAGLGAKQIIAVDVSRIANAWAEYKFQAFGTLSYNDFQQRLAQSDATWENFPFWLPVSDDAQKIFRGYKKETKRLIDTTEVFMSQGYAASDPALVGYLQSEEQYTLLQKSAQNAEVCFFPTDITAFFEHERPPEGYFTTMYLSNILDHTTKESPKIGKQDFDFSKERMVQVFQPLLRYVNPTGTIILNIQWSKRAYEGIEKAVHESSFTIERLERTRHGGCGSMYIVRKG